MRNEPLDPQRISAAWIALGAGIAIPVVMGLAALVIGEVDLQPGMGYYQDQFASLTQQATALLAIEVLLLVFLVGLAHAASTVRGPCVLRSTVVALASLTSAVAAAMHSLYLLPLGSAGMPADASGLPDQGVITMISDLQAWWFSPVFAPLVGATLLALGALLRRSDLGARALGGACAAAGLLGFAVLALTTSPTASTWWWSTLVVPALMLWTLVWLGLVLRDERRRARAAVPAPTGEAVR